jgi:hypothetical protein
MMLCGASGHAIPTCSHGVMVTKTIVMHVIVTTVTVAVRKCANIGWRLDEAPGKTARPLGLKWLRQKRSCCGAPKPNQTYLDEVR